MFTIDRYSPIPIYEQLIAQFERLILLGILAPNAVLPSVRALSQELSVNPNTIQKAYTELERRGLSFTAPGTAALSHSTPSRSCVAKKKPCWSRQTSL